jgi:hypothetical protein
MNRDVEGIRGQFVTTWGSDVVDGVIIPNTVRALKTSLTCRCGKSVSYKGFPEYRSNRKAGFVAPLPPVSGKTPEWFCGLPCVISLEPDAYYATLETAYTGHMKALDAVLDRMLALKDAKAIITFEKEPT